MRKLITALFAAIMIVFPANAHHDHLLWSPEGWPEDHERGPWFQTIDLEAIDWAITYVEDDTRQGPTAIRFEVRPGDCFTAHPHNPESGWDDCTRDRERSELREKWEPPLEQTTHYMFSMKIPEDYEYMYPKQIFFQFHGGPGPVVYFQLKREVFLIDILTEVGQTTTQYEIGELPKGEWLDFQITAIWSNTDSGYLRVVLNGEEILEHIGPTMDDTSYAEGAGPFVKFGIYRSHLFRWVEERVMPTLVLFFDEYRRSDIYEEVLIENNEGD